MGTITQQFAGAQSWPFTNPFYAHLDQNLEKLLASKDELEKLKKEYTSLQARVGALERCLHFAGNALDVVERWCMHTPGVYTSDIEYALQTYRDYLRSELTHG